MKGRLIVYVDPGGGDAKAPVLTVTVEDDGHVAVHAMGKTGVVEENKSFAPEFLDALLRVMNGTVQFTSPGKREVS